MEFVKSIPSGRQRGLSLIYAMLALAVLALATVALIRSVSTGAVVAGNLGFQQEATAAADQAVRQAIASLGARLAAASTGLDADGVIAGYYASTDDLVDVTGSQSSLATRKLVKWDTDFCATQPSGSYDSASCASLPLYAPAAVSAINRNAASYVVFRLCDRAGDPVADTSINCARPLAASANSGTNEGRDYTGGSGTSTSVVTPYYRIIVRVTGARNTTSYTETIVHF